MKINLESGVLNVMIPAYNVEEFIEPCLDSVFEQDWLQNSRNKINVVVCVDGCGKTKDKIQAISHKYKNLTVLYCEENKGTYISLNTILSTLKTGNLIVFGADDMMNSNMLSEIFKVNKAGFVKSHGVLVAPVSLIKKHGGFMPWRCAGDTELLVRMKMLGFKSHVYPYLFHRRRHAGQITKSKKYGHGTEIRKKYVKIIESDRPAVIVPEINNYVKISGKTISFNVATYPAREATLKKAIESVINKVDVVRVCLNNYKKIPKWLAEMGVECVIPSEDLKDTGKFLWSTRLKDEIYFTGDDDLIYTAEYFREHIKSLEKYNGEKFITSHGKQLKGNATELIDMKANCRCLDNLENDTFVNVGGTGVMCFDLSKIKVNIKKYKCIGCADLGLGAFAVENGIDIVVRNHSANELKYLLEENEKDTLFMNRNLEQHERIISKINRYKIEKTTEVFVNARQHRATVQIEIDTMKKFSKIPPEVSVNVNLYEMPYIARMCFGGLCLQEIDVAWELIVIQERKEMFDFDEYIPRLKEKGCVKITQILLDRHVPLGWKIKRFSEIMSPKSKMGMIIGGDDKPHKKKIQNSYDAIVVKGFDAYCEEYGYFYDFTLKKTFKFVHDKTRSLVGLASTAYPRKAFKTLTDDLKTAVRYLDNTVFNMIKPTNICFNYDEHLDGVYTNGYNKISTERLKSLTVCEPPFFKTDIDICKKAEIDLLLSGKFLCPVKEVKNESRQFLENIDIRMVAINAKDERPRRGMFIDECTKAGIVSDIFTAIPYQDPRVRNHVDKLEMTGMKFDCRKKASEMSNRLSFAEILGSDLTKSIIIFEDDVYFKTGAKQIIREALKELPKNFGVCYLGCYMRNAVNLEKHSNHLVRIKHVEKQEIWGAHAIIYSPKVRKYLSERLRHKDANITDFEIVNSVIPKFDCFITNPMICFQSQKVQKYTNYKMHGNFDLEFIECKSFEFFNKGLRSQK